MRSKTPLAAVICVTLGAACMNKAADQPAATEMVRATPPADQPAAQGRQALGVPTAPAPTRVAGVAEAAEAPLSAMYMARKLVRTGQLTVEVGGYDEAAARAAAIAESHGGYVAETQASRGSQDRQQGTITVRVPAERFSDAFAAFKALGKVRAEAVSTQDITKAYSDLETRLRVKRDAAARLREILRGRTARLSDVLEAERELGRVTEEIERMEGERRFYDQQVALSTITVALQEPQSVMEPGVFSPIGQAFRQSLEVLATSLAALIYAAVFLAPWTLVALVVWKTVRAVRRRRAAPQA